MTEYVSTFIGKDLSAEKVQALAASMPSGRVEWQVRGQVCDVFTPAAPDVAGLRLPEGVDVLAQPAANRRKKLLVADMESTIITCECLDELAELAGIREKIAAITARAMNGELNFESALRERVGLLKGLPEAALQQVMEEKVRLMPGARVLVQAMHEAGAHTVLVSGGFDFFASRVAEMLGFHAWRANRLEIADGKLTGRVQEPILGKEAKVQALRECCVRQNISTADALAVGDGANDLPMLIAAGLGVAYHAKPAVQAEARHRVNHADLRALLFAQGIAA